MSRANFSAFYRNKSGYRRPPPTSDSSIDFRFRNAEKWFEERRVFRAAPPSPGLKKSVHSPSESEEISNIPSYDCFDYTGSELEPDKYVNLLPDNWESLKWQQGMAEDVRSEWFTLPPSIQEGKCTEYSSDLPLFIYECGQTTLNALPFYNMLQHDYFMLAFQYYYNKQMFGV